MRYYELNFKINPNDSQDARDLLSALLAEVGFESFQYTAQGLDGFVQQQLWDCESVEAVIGNFPMQVDITYERKEAVYVNWNEQWENECLEPIVIANELCIHDTRHTGMGQGYDITISPRMAFGSGTHPTTQMILEELLNAELEGKRVIDAGCGTGVLGILCLMRGSQHVLAYDIDEWSTENAVMNFALNGLDAVEVRLGNSSCICGERDYDLVLANINRNLLLADLGAWQEVLHNRGELMLSGFYTTDVPLIAAKAVQLGMSVKKEKARGDWSLLWLTLGRY